MDRGDRDLVAVRVVDEVRVGIGSSAHGRRMGSQGLGRLLMLGLWLIALNGGLLWMIRGLLLLLWLLLWLLIRGLLVGRLLIGGLIGLLIRRLLVGRWLIRLLIGGLLIAWRGLLIRSGWSSLLLTSSYQFIISYGIFDKTGLPIW